MIVRKGLPLTKHISAFARRGAVWSATAADYYTAAAVYEQLSRLSDAELQRRRLSRATLARNVCAACDRGNGRAKGRPGHHDPMREIDLLLLEDAMTRGDFDTNASARAAQTACLLLVLAILTVIFTYALTNGNAASWR
jgi:hypothetical protein